MRGGASLHPELRSQGVHKIWSRQSGRDGTTLESNPIGPLVAGVTSRRGVANFFN
jgi:hypothetical protein